MNKSNLTTLGFFVLLLCIQIEGRPLDRVLEDFDDWNNVNEVNEISTGGRELAQSEARAPQVAPSREVRDFEDEVHDAIDDCKRNPGGPWIWMRGIRVKGTKLRISKVETKSVCRCACQRAVACNAVHYEKNPDECVFHSGGKPIIKKAFRPWIKRAWVKP